MIFPAFKSSTRLTAALSVARMFFQKLNAIIFRMTARDSWCVAIILVAAFLLRMPMLDHPPLSQFDEVTYVNFTLFTAAEKPFFDIHPRLAHALFAIITKSSGELRTSALPQGYGVSFDDFPYVPLRMFIAWMGILLVLIIYAIGRVLEYSPRAALVPALFILLDGALTIYGRTILPDTLLLFFNFLGILFALLAAKTRSKTRSLFFTLAAGIALGCALSVKWLAGGVVLSVVALYFLYRRFASGVAIGAISVLAYTALFALILFTFFQNGGSVKNYQNVIYPAWVTEMNFPQTDSFSSVLKFLPPLHVAMFRANNDPDVLLQTLPSPSPLSWPISRSEMIFFTGAGGAGKIVMTGNSLLWVVSFFALLFNFFWIYFTWKRTQRFPIKKDEVFLIVGYCANYLPFFLIDRPMYLYHYFTALLFLFLLLPKIAPRLCYCLGSVTNDRLFAKTFLAATVLLIMTNFFLTLPLTYGF